jgi:hypothetical protein
MSSFDLNFQILKVLASGDAVWDRCCGPNGNGISEATLLTELQILYPESNWTSVLLSVYLLTSQRQGRVKQLPLDSWYFNSAMNIVNPANKVYKVTGVPVCEPRSTCGCNGPNNMQLGVY